MSINSSTSWMTPPPQSSDQVCTTLPTPTSTAVLPGIPTPSSPMEITPSSEKEDTPSGVETTLVIVPPAAPPPEVTATEVQPPVSAPEQEIPEEKSTEESSTLKSASPPVTPQKTKPTTPSSSDPPSTTVIPIIPPPSSPVIRGGKGVAFAKTAPSPVKPKATRSPRKKTVPLAVYQSQISDNKIGIKLCLKKSVDVVVAKTKKVVRRLTGKAAATAAISTAAASISAGVGAKKKGRKRKTTLDDSDSDELNYRRRRRKQDNNNETTIKNHNSSNSNPEDKKSSPASTSSRVDQRIEETPIDMEQSCWALTIPENVLTHIFRYVTASEGCLPTLVRLSSVSSLWRRVALQPSLWHTMDLTTWVKERHRNELKLKWFLLNRLSGCTDLNLANWKVMNVQVVMNHLAENCPKLSGLILSGWKSLMSDHLMFIVTEMKNLQRIDLSAINTEVNANKTAVGLQSLSNAVQAMGERLRHLHLANNRLGGLPQLINSLSSHCPNLALLDLSNITTMAVSHAVLPLEKLQTGCPKLKVFRITNAQVTLGTATLQEQMESPGFPELEELSIASFSRTICDDFVQRILKTSTKLRLLDVRGCPRITHDSLIRLPAWDLKHLFLSGCNITRDVGSGLELIASKWAHSLVEFDLAWGNAQKPLDSALRALAEKRSESRLNHLDLCGSSVSLEAVQEVLQYCPALNSINLSSCRGLPRGMKRLLQGPAEMKDLREALGVELKVQVALKAD